MIAALFAGTLLILAAYVSTWLPHGTPTWGVWVMIVGSALSMAATTALGARNSDVAPGRSRLIALFLMVVIVAGFGAPLLLPVENTSGPLLFGLPLRAAIEIYGVGILPILVLPWLYAMEFRNEGLDEAALAGLRHRCAELTKR